MDPFHQKPDIVHWGFRQDTVPEVENISGPAFVFSEYAAHGFFYEILWPEKNRGIEISLNSNFRSQNFAGTIESHMPVKSDDIRFGPLDKMEHGSSAPYKQNNRNLPPVQSGNQVPRERENKSFIIGRRQQASPGVKNLHRLNSGGNLGIQVKSVGFGDFFHQSIEQFWCAEHHLLEG